MYNRGDIYYINFGRYTGTHEQGGIRPAVIVSNNKNNRNSPVVTVVPLSARIWKKSNLPTHVLIPGMTGLSKPSMALAEQVATVDKRCLQNRAGHVNDSEVMKKITEALQIQIGAYAEYN